MNRCGAGLKFSFAIFIAYLPAPCYPQPINHLIEVRRTFASTECDSGDVYIDGKRVGLFGASPTLFSTPQLLSKIFSVTVKEHAANQQQAPLGFIKNTFDVQVVEGGDYSFSFLPLSSQTYRPFTKRIRKSALTNNQIVIGYSAINRECLLTASRSVVFFDESDKSWENIPNVLRNALSLPSPASSTGALLVFTDKARRLRMSINGKVFEMTYPARPATSVVKGDPCLRTLEHMGNTIHRGDAVTYERRDDVVTCTNGSFDGRHVVEILRDVRFIEFQDIQACAFPLGLPVGRSYYVLTPLTGDGGAVFTECLNGSYKAFADRSYITWE